MGNGGPEGPDEEENGDDDDVEYVYVDKNGLYQAFFDIVKIAWVNLGDKLGLHDRFELWPALEGIYPIPIGTTDNTEGYYIPVKLVAKNLLKKGGLHYKYSIIIVSDSNLRRMNNVLSQFGNEACVRSNPGNPTGESFLIYVPFEVLLEHISPILN